MEGHGREEWIGPIDLSRTVGWFTTLYPVALDLEGAQDEGSALKLVKEALRAVPDRGLSYGVLRYAPPTTRSAKQLAAQPRRSCSSTISASSTRSWQARSCSGSPTSRRGAWHGPANERTHRLEVVSLVRDGRFEARWIYGAERDGPEIVERLAEDFLAALRRVIEHCAESGVRGYTPSDFPLARLEQEALDRIASRHPEIEDVYPLSPMQRLFLSMEAGACRARVRAVGVPPRG